MTNNTNATTTSQFRNKFENQLQNCPDVLRKKIKEATAKFVNNPDNEKCHSTLWLMTHSPEKAVKAFGLELDVPAETTTTDDEAKATPTASVAKPRISKELVTTWRDELRYQRTLVHPDFLKIEVAESCKNAYMSILNATDAITAVAAYNACYERCICSPSEDIERALGLLASQKESFYFGGIRSLHFGRAAALVFKEYHNELHDLLEALWNEEKARRQSSGHTPLKSQMEKWLNEHAASIPSQVSDVSADVVETISEMLPDAKEKACQEHDATPEKASVIPTASTSDAEKTITAVNITADEIIFEKFLEACQALKDAGYDCTKVVGKMDAIAKILEASKILNG